MHCAAWLLPPCSSPSYIPASSPSFDFLEVLAHFLDALLLFFNFLSLWPLCFSISSTFPLFQLPYSLKGRSHYRNLLRATLSCLMTMKKPFRYARGALITACTREFMQGWTESWIQRAFCATSLKHSAACGQNVSRNLNYSYTRDMITVYFQFQVSPKRATCVLVVHNANCIKMLKDGHCIVILDDQHQRCSDRISRHKYRVQWAAKLLPVLYAFCADGNPTLPAPEIRLSKKMSISTAIR